MIQIFTKTLIVPCKKIHLNSFLEATNVQIQNITLYRQEFLSYAKKGLSAWLLVWQLFKDNLR